MDNLAALATRETAVLRRIASVTGTIEHITNQLKKLGVYEEYKSIHRAYAQLLGHDLGQEALKRALFIQWFSLSAPAFLSGIDEVETEAELLVNTRLNLLLEGDQADAELISMLSLLQHLGMGLPAPRIRAFEGIASVGEGHRRSFRSRSFFRSSRAAFEAG